MIAKKILTVAILLSVSAMALTGCASAKKGCGCGADINRAYKSPKRFH